MLGAGGDCERLFAIADEDLERENDTKTSAVHFLRFELGETDGRRAQAWGRTRRSASITLTTGTSWSRCPTPCARRCCADLD